MSSFPAIIFCHHTDLDVEPARAWCHQPYKTWPSLVSLKIDYLRKKGFSPFFIVVTDAEAAKTCEKYQAEDVHVVQIPVHVIPAAPKINRRVWNVYNPRAEVENYSYAAYMICKNLNYEAIYSETGYSHPQHEEILQAVLDCKDWNFDFGLGFSSLGMNLVYPAVGLKKFYETPSKTPLVDADYPPDDGKPKVFTVKDRGLTDGVQRLRDCRVLTEYRFKEWCDFLDHHGQEYIDTPHQTILKYGAEFFNTVPKVVPVRNEADYENVSKESQDTALLRVSSSEEYGQKLLEQGISAGLRLHVKVHWREFPAFLSKFPAQVAVWDLSIDVPTLHILFESLETTVHPLVLDLLKALISLESVSEPIVGLSILHHDNPVELVATYRLVQKVIRPSLFVGSASLRWKSRYLFDFVKVESATDTISSLGATATFS